MGMRLVIIINKNLKKEFRIELVKKVFKQIRNHSDLINIWLIITKINQT